MILMVSILKAHNAWDCVEDLELAFVIQNRYTSFGVAQVYADSNLIARLLIFL